jgi:FMN phosphatase YigB (HAD superfamily)
MLPEAIFFDLDDTLLNDNRASEVAWQKACEISANKTGLFSSQELFKRINVIRKQYWSDPKRYVPYDEARLTYCRRPGKMSGFIVQQLCQYITSTNEFPSLQ